ncbi:hypothetical protein FSW04_03540 [Baekduia soli]|uniref:AtuA-like ferredoxin-fold domain-containing protein n=1 Tax=Baekduia soli TaxID=496014 RepID=A0A5B8U143_9ACTN|nr:hypothetical protein [Baekduia soli]QEC46749.1 hypothetical protein FSW04_03540 [Baekduia soli]
MGGLTVGDIACGRSGDKGTTLDLTVVAADAGAYATLEAHLGAELVAGLLGAPRAVRHEVPGLLALKFVLEGALDAGPWASRRAGMHWQKAAISPVLALTLAEIGAAPA